MTPVELKRNNWVIYRKQKVGVSPGPRAIDVHPATKGDIYRYCVEKYWVVEEVLDSGQVKLRTRRGKRNIVSADDPLLRVARWWERWLHRKRFEAIELTDDGDTEDSTKTSVTPERAKTLETQKA